MSDWQDPKAVDLMLDELLRWTEAMRGMRSS